MIVYWVLVFRLTYIIYIHNSIYDCCKWLRILIIYIIVNEYIRYLNIYQNLLISNLGIILYIVMLYLCILTYIFI